MTGDIIITGPWVKSSLSFANGNCVEAANFRTASASLSNGHCAEVGSCARGVAVRDTKDRSGPVLVFGGGAWERFAGRVRRGEAIMGDA
jgi:hypothetical protein